MPTYDPTTDNGKRPRYIGYPFWWGNGASQKWDESAWVSVKGFSIPSPFAANLWPTIGWLISGWLELARSQSHGSAS